MKNLVLCFMMFVACQSFAADSIRIKAEHNADRERRTKTLLEKVLRDYDLTKYTFTHEVSIEERAMNHAFPELTLNVRFLPIQKMNCCRPTFMNNCTGI